MEFTRRVFQIEDPGNLRQVLQTICSPRKMVAVNIGVSTESNLILLTEENLRDLLAGAPEALVVDTVPIREFKAIVREKINQVMRSAAALREALRVQFVSDLEQQVAALLSEIESTVLILRCYSLQAEPGARVDGIGRLQDLQIQLAASSSEHRDNVRCMDDLHHGILPVLKTMHKIFRQ